MKKSKKQNTPIQKKKLKQLYVTEVRENGFTLSDKPTPIQQDKIREAIERFDKKFKSNLWKEDSSGGIHAWVTCDEDVKDFIVEEIRKAYKKGQRDADMVWIRNAGKYERKADLAKGDKEWKTKLKELIHAYNRSDKYEDGVSVFMIHTKMHKKLERFFERELKK